MWAHVCSYCSINYSSASFTSLQISALTLRIWNFPGTDMNSMCTAWQVRANTQWVITYWKPHKSMHADFYRPITHGVIAVWAGRLSCQEWHWAGCAVGWCWDWMRMRTRRRLEGAFPLCPSDRLLDISAARRQTSHSSLRSRAATGHFQDLERIRESDSICFPSPFLGGIRGERQSPPSRLTGCDSLKRSVFAPLPLSFVHTSSRHGMWDSCGLAWPE